MVTNVERVTILRPLRHHTRGAEPKREKERAMSDASFKPDDSAGDSHAPLSLAPLAAARPTVEPAVVLHVRTSRGGGGEAERNIMRLAASGVAPYLRQIVVILHAPDDSGIEILLADARRIGCPILTVPRRGPLDTVAARTLLQLCRQSRAALWHAHDSQASLLGVMLRSLWPMKLVTTVHALHEGGGSLRQRVRHASDKICLPRCDRVIAASPAIREQCIDLSVADGQLSCIPFGIDLDSFKRTHSIRAARVELGVWPEAVVMGVASPFTEEKGVDRAIRTFAQLLPRYSNLELHLVGDGPQYDALKQLAVELGVAAKVYFWGSQPTPQRWYEFFDLALVPGQDENFAAPVLEAMAMEVPAAATRVGGADVLLKDGRCGVLLDPRRPETWADEIAPLIVSEDRRRELGRRARARAEKHFGLTRRAEKIVAIYDELLSIAPQKIDLSWRRAA